MVTVPVTASDPKVYFSYGDEYICATYDTDNIYYDSEGNCVLDCYVIWLTFSAIGTSTLTSVEIQEYYMSDYVEILYPVSGVDKYVIAGISSLGDSPYLTEITIPDTVSYISGYAFYECPSLTTVNFSDDNKYYCFEDGAIYSADKTELVYYLSTNTSTSFTVPDTVTKIGSYAFANNTYLTSVTMSDNVTVIGGNVFSGCTSLTDVYYEGTSGEWDCISINSSNTVLKSATVHYAFSGYAIKLDVWTIFADGTYDFNDTSSVGSASSTGGTVTAVKTADEGETVSLTVEVNDGYAIEYISAWGSTKVSLVEQSDGTYTFTMPASDVSVSVEFGEVTAEYFYIDGIALGTEHWYSKYDEYTRTITFEEDGGWNGWNFNKITDPNLESITISVGDIDFVNDDVDYVLVFVTYTDGTQCENYLELQANSTGTLLCDDNEIWYIVIVGGEGTAVVEDVSVVERESCAHSTLTHVEATDATCESNGNIEYWYCADCDKYYSDEDATTEIELDDTVISATGHTTETQNAKDATCTEDGYTGDEVCTVCGETITTGDVIPATGHYYIPYFTWADDYSSATAKFTCRDCDYEETFDAVITSETTPATCTEDGEIVYSATVTLEGDIYMNSVTEVISATGHDYEAVVTEPTCTQDGYTTYTCSNCGDTYTADETEALGHDYTFEVTKEATCTEAGVITYTCTRCGDTYTEEIEATGHNYVATETSATCTDGGYTVYVCSECGDTYTDNATEALGHDYESEVTKEPTCTETGIMAYTCARCGESYTEEIAATGHTYTSEVTTEPTCTETGVMTYTCSVCGDSYTEEIAATGHTYTSEVTTEATCTEAGVMTYTCSACGDTYTEEIAATGHTLTTAKENYVAPTVTEDGSYELVTYCSVCGEEISRETVVVPATGEPDLSTIRADYTAVKNAIAKANALNPDDYINFSDVTAAINSVNWTYSVAQQSAVAEMASKIEKAIANLISADTVTEEVTIIDPIEDTDTQTEDDETEPEVEPEVTETETNPTTGIVLAMLPMTIALAGALLSKKK